MKKRDPANKYKYCKWCLRRYHTESERFHKQKGLTKDEARAKAKAWLLSQGETHPQTRLKKPDEEDTDTANRAVGDIIFSAFHCIAAEPTIDQAFVGIGQSPTPSTPS